jgi:hypothetical protein
MPVMEAFKPCLIVAVQRNRYPGQALTPRTVESVTMNLKMHQAIAGKLEAGKTAGWLSEYLVAWHGTQDRLLPKVTVWRSSEQDDDTIKSYLAGLLTDLVPARAIVIADP